MPRNANRGGGSRSDQPMFSGWTDTAKDNPFATAAVAAAAVGAGVFLWNRRNQISDQLSNLSDQISDWSANMRSGSETGEFETMGAGGSSMSSSATGSTSSRTSRSAGSRPTATRSTGARSTGTTARGRARTPRGMSETGGGNASLGAHTGSGRGGDEL